MKFLQEEPTLQNQYYSDPILKQYLESIIPEKPLKEISKDLENLGDRTTKEILDAGNRVQENEPYLEQYDPWGKRVDKIITDPGWVRLREIAAEENLVGIGYDKKFGSLSRVYQFAKILLYTPSSAIYTCPLAMTDGAAKVIQEKAPEELSDIFDHLTSNDPNEFWTAGQWMTEKEGGSDVGQSSTIAKQVKNSVYELYGDKWFTSAITGEIAMTLARIQNDVNDSVGGSKGLSLFYLKIREEGKLNNIQINKLKNKLGTRALPTAELTLNGTKATLIGEVGNGVKEISTILNITRIYNAVSSIAYMQRGLALAKDYATKREAFGKKIIDHPLHLDVLVDLEIQYVCSFFLVFHVIELMGKSETGEISPDELATLRILTPIIKLYTGKQAVAFLSEVIEAIGGQGYIEDTGIPALLRDAQVFPIWEGTTNILSLDVLRSIEKENSLKGFLSYISSFLISYDGKIDTNSLKQAIEDLTKYQTKLLTVESELKQLSAKKLAFSLAKLTILFRLIKFSQGVKDQKLKDRLEIIIKRLNKKDLLDLFPLDSNWLKENGVFARYSQ